MIFPGPCQCYCPGCAGRTETVQDPSENTFTNSEELSQLEWAPNGPGEAKRHSMSERIHRNRNQDRNGTPDPQPDSNRQRHSTVRCSNCSKPKYARPEFGLFLCTLLGAKFKKRNPLQSKKIKTSILLGVGSDTLGRSCT